MGEDGSNSQQDNENDMQIQAEPYRKRQTQPLRVDRQTAALVRRLDTLAPGMRVIVVVDILADGRRAWSLAHCTEEAGG